MFADCAVVPLSRTAASRHPSGEPDMASSKLRLRSCASRPLARSRLMGPSGAAPLLLVCLLSVASTVALSGRRGRSYRQALPLRLSELRAGVSGRELELPGTTTALRAAAQAGSTPPRGRALRPTPPGACRGPRWRRRPGSPPREECCASDPTFGRRRVVLSRAARATPRPICLRQESTICALCPTATWSLPPTLVSWWLTPDAVAAAALRLRRRA